MVLDVVYNHVGASGNKADHRLRPVLHAQARDALGRLPERRRRALRPRPRVGLPERRAVDSRLPLRRPAAGRDPRDRRLQPRAPRRRGRAARARHQPGRAGDRRVRDERPEGHARRPNSAARAATPPGPTTSTTRCASCSRARPRAGTRSSTRSRCWPRPSGARTCTTATTRRSASAGSGRPRTTCAPSASSSSPPITTRSATARSATGCRSTTRPLAAFCTLLSPFTPMLFQGEEYGERAPFQFFTDHIDPRSPTRPARGAGASSPRSPRSPARRCPIRRTSRPSSAPS